MWLHWLCIYIYIYSASIIVNLEPRDGASERAVHDGVSKPQHVFWLCTTLIAIPRVNQRTKRNKKACKRKEPKRGYTFLYMIFKHHELLHAVDNLYPHININMKMKNFTFNWGIANKLIDSPMLPFEGHLNFHGRPQRLNMVEFNFWFAK